jgi:hypothetical protein
VRAGVAEADAECRELLGDLLAGQRRGERDVGVAAVVALPGAAGLDGADPGLLLQVRTRVLNNDLAAAFARWYPGLTSPDQSLDAAA